MFSENGKITELLSGCRLNDRNSQKELYYLLRGFAMKICIRYTNNFEESEEVMNEAFIKLFKHVQQFDETRHADLLVSLKGWFKRILVNSCIDHYRKHKSSVNGHTLTTDSETLPDHSENGVDLLSFKEIIEAIKHLSPGYRTVFNLFVIDGLSHEEIAKKLGISVGASKSNLSKARDNLRKYLLKKSHYNIYESPF